MTRAEACKRMIRAMMESGDSTYTVEHTIVYYLQLRGLDNSFARMLTESLVTKELGRSANRGPNDRPSRGGK